MKDRRRMIAAQPHLVTLNGSGGLVTFNSTIVAPLEITAVAGATVTSCGKNLFNKNAVGVGDNIGTDGSISYFANARLSDYIPVPGGKAVFWAAQISGTANLRVGKYDASKGWISRGTSTKVSGYSVYILDDPTVAYVRVCLFVNSEDIDTAMLELGTTRTTFEAFNGSTSNHASKVGYNAVFADSGAITVKYWTH